MNPPLLSAGIVVYHSDTARLRATLESLARAAAVLQETTAIRTRLWVIDNGASECPLGELPVSPEAAGRFLGVERIDSPLNLGYGAAHNLALNRGLGEFHLVLNPDVELDEAALVHAVGYLRSHPQAAGVVPHGLDANGAALYLAKGHPSLLVLAARALASLTGLQIFGGLQADYELRETCAASRPAEVSIGSGCCMLLRGACFASVRGFSEEFFLYFEDFDLSRRLSVLGPLIYLPQMRIVHHGGGTARKGLRHVLMFCRSAARYFSRWGWRVW